MSEGHYRHFKKVSRFKNIYALPREKLFNKGYQISNGLISKYIFEHIKGRGVLVDKKYNLKEANDGEPKKRK